MTESGSQTFVAAWLRERRDAEPSNQIVKAIAENVVDDVLNETALVKRLTRLATISDEPAKR